MTKRREHGRETWHRLKEWDIGQTAAERLSFNILSSEGYESIDPSHPLGGRDGLKDMKCSKNGIKWIGACYFPRGQKSFTVIKNKFLQDLKGVEKNNVQGIAFITNQEITVKQRESLVRLSKHHVDIFNIDRIASILNLPINYGVRADFLNIEMTDEENVSFTAARDKLYIQSIQSEIRDHNYLNENIHTEFKPTKNIDIGDVYLADLGNGIGNEQVGTRPVVIVSNRINNRFASTVTVVPVTSQIARAKLPTHVELGFFPNADKESVALIEQIKTVSKMRLRNIITTLDTGLIEKIKECVSVHIGLF